MKKIIAVFVCAGLVILAATVVSFGAEPVKAEEKSKLYEVGDVLKKPIEVQNLEGKVVPLDLKKGLTAISFFNTMCSACRSELQYLNTLRAQTKNFNVAAICMDADGASLPNFIETMKWDLTYYKDPSFNSAEMFGYNFTPALVVLKDNGEVVYKKAGFSERFQPEIEKVLSK